MRIQKGDDTMSTSNVTRTPQPNWRPDYLADGGYARPGWADLPAASPAPNDRTIMYLILKAMKDGALDDLKALEKTISENNQKKSALREIRKAVSQGVSTNDKGQHQFDATKVPTITYTDPTTGEEKRLNYTQMQAEYTRLTGQTLDGSNAQVLTNIDNDISTLGDFGQELATKMQLYNQRFTEASDLLTGILNSWHGAIKKIIGNIGQA